MQAKAIQACIAQATAEEEAYPIEMERMADPVSYNVSAAGSAIPCA